MEIAVATGDISRFEADAIIVNLFEDTENLNGDLAVLDNALDGGISGLLRSPSSTFGPCTTWPGGTDSVRNTPPLMTEPAPMIVSPPRMVAPA